MFGPPLGGTERVKPKKMFGPPLGGTERVKTKTKSVCMIVGRLGDNSKHLALATKMFGPPLGGTETR